MQFLVKNQKKEKLEKKSFLQKELSTKEVLVGFGIFGAVLVYGGVFVYPKYTDYKSAVANLNSIETEIATYEGRIGEMPVLKGKLEDLEKELRVKSKILSHNMEDGIFFIGLSNLMKDLNVGLVDYSLDEIIPYNTFEAIPTSITVRGDYRKVKEIMYYLENQKNMTQILDYSMENYIPQEENNENTNTNNGTTATSVVPNELVYWTTSGSAYHIDTCQVLEAEKTASGTNALSGSPSVSGKTSPCQVCKPYTEVQAPQVKPQEQTKPKPNGVVEAKFKFIMYSSKDPKLELNNEDSSKWQPGKYNPFESTI